MSYSSAIYLGVFLTLVFLGYFLTPIKKRWIVLTVSSMLFYMITSSWLIVFMIISALSIYIFGKAIGQLNDVFNSMKEHLDRKEKKALKEKLIYNKKLCVVLTLVVNFGLLIFLKYFNFFGGLFNDGLSLLHLSIHIPTLKLFLPLGISFYTLQAVSYVIDVYRGKYEADQHFGRLFLYLIFFPTVVEGPIAKYDEVAHQLYEGHEFNYLNLCHGYQLILWGMFKKLVIADRANIFVSSVFTSEVDLNPALILLGIVFYTMQLYCEFSGCMDIVRGSAQIFGINLPENFKQPFFSHSINEFWRRWHITLGTWLKEYVFFSVSLSKPFNSLSMFVKKHFNAYLGKLLPTTFALLFVWLFNGLWHGSSMKYVMYGMYYYIFMMIGMYAEPVFQKVCDLLHINRNGKVFGVFQILRTFVLVNIGMLIFKADTLSQAWAMLSHLVKNIMSMDFSLITTMGLEVNELILLFIGFIIVFVVGIIKEKNINIRETIDTKPVVLRWSIYLVALFAILVFGAYGKGYESVGFIYAQF